jgi:oligo-1,6-glucosidase
MVFHFEMHDLDGRVDMPLLPKAWKLPELKRIIAKWQNAMEAGNGWNSI